jgi:hypothetical protein
MQTVAVENASFGIRRAITKLRIVEVSFFISVTLIQWRYLRKFAKGVAVSFSQLRVPDGIGTRREIKGYTNIREWNAAQNTELLARSFATRTRTASQGTKKSDLRAEKSAKRKRAQDELESNTAAAATIVLRS